MRSVSGSCSGRNERQFFLGCFILSIFVGPYQMTNVGGKNWGVLSTPFICHGSPHHVSMHVVRMSTSRANSSQLPQGANHGQTRSLRAIQGICF